MDKIRALPDLAGLSSRPPLATSKVDRFVGKRKQSSFSPSTMRKKARIEPTLRTPSQNVPNWLASSRASSPSLSGAECTAVFRRRTPVCESMYGEHGATLSAVPDVSPQLSHTHVSSNEKSPTARADDLFSYAVPSDFEPMPFGDEDLAIDDHLNDSGFAEACSSIHTCEGISHVSNHQLHDLASDLERNYKHTASGSHISFSTVPPSHFSEISLKAVEPATFVPSHFSSDSGYLGNISDQAVGSYSLYSGISRLPSPIRHTESRFRRYTPERFSSLEPAKNEATRNSSPQTDTDVVLETLWDMTQGRLFEPGTDTWAIAKSRLGVPPSLNEDLPVDDDVSLLRLGRDTRGVGYRTQGPLGRPEHRYEDSSSWLNDVEEPWITQGSQNVDDPLEYYTTQNNSYPSQTLQDFLSAPSRNSPSAYAVFDANFNSSPLLDHNCTTIAPSQLLLLSEPADHTRHGRLDAPSPLPNNDPTIFMLSGTFEGDQCKSPSGLALAEAHSLRRNKEVALLTEHLVDSPILTGLILPKGSSPTNGTAQYISADTNVSPGRTPMPDSSPAQKPISTPTRTVPTTGLYVFEGPCLFSEADDDLSDDD
ncbi:hypothetical protein K474DRAFT_1664254 [Panus rudis PR-1116 ss-1]|nr:hypothetical protein K474DRAFT_1664254 [Panus rudis PR-1116 ss-1]